MLSLRAASIAAEHASTERFPAESKPLLIATELPAGLPTNPSSNCLPDALQLANCF